MVGLSQACRYCSMGFSPRVHTGKLLLSIGRIESFTALEFRKSPIQR
jgi:hypothetical protein